MDSTIRDQAYQFFVQEAKDFLTTIESGLLSLREDASIGKIHSMMRAAHSIKGGAASVELPAIQKIAHRLEDIFRALYRHEGQQIGVEMEELLLQAFDCLRLPLMHQIEHGWHNPEEALAQAESVFSVVEAYFGDSLGEDVELPTAQELGFDIAQTIFSSDVTDGINRLISVMEDPHTPQLAGEIRAQAEVFAGIGELLNLAGFTEIARTTLRAIELHPEQARAIGAAAIANFQAGQAQVLAGDRTHGGSPSPELLAFVPDLPPQLPPEHPPATEVTAITETSSATAIKPQTIRETPIAPSEAVRVDLLRLDRLNNQFGELVTQENFSLLQNQRMQMAVARLQRAMERFQILTNEVRQWIDTSQKQQVRQTSSSSLADFDPLHLDSYSYFYIRMQEAVEEMGQMSETMRDMALITQQQEQNHRRKQQTFKQIRDDLLRARMLPLSEILPRFPRMIRDLSVQYQKRVRLKIVGGNTLVDKAILEKLYDPLVHLVRNAFDHGAEPPEVRLAQGKPAEATIEIAAYHRGNQTVIEVRDDGQGIKVDKVKAIAVQRQMLSAAEAESLSEPEVYELLFAPSFSTADAVSELSGRGVGLSTVRQQVQALKGTVSLTSIPNVGTTFSIRLPLTLTVTKLLVFAIDKYLMAIPVDSLTSVVTASITDMQTVQGKQYYLYESELIPVYPISAFVRNYPLPPNSDRPFQQMELPSDVEIPLLIISGNIALEIDYIIAEQELAIKPFGKLINPPPYLYGCTILGDGSLVPVIDGSALVSTWQARSTTSQLSLAGFNDETLAVFAQATILVVDDSLTARETLSLTLKKAGYRVLQAGDGKEALDKIAQEPSIQAIFCDIEMPIMNGFEFLNQYRQEYPQSDRQIIMLTSRNSDKHRSLAKMLGASAYLTKPYIEQELLALLKDLVVAK
jgi:chemotaxis family two-component system sensor histidine kinase/response regulator PixL